MMLSGALDAMHDAVATSLLLNCQAEKSASPSALSVSVGVRRISEKEIERTTTSAKFAERRPRARGVDI